MTSFLRRALVLSPLAALALAAACTRTPPPDPRTASGYVEATDVKVSAKVAGRVAEVAVSEGQRVTPGQVLVRLATTDTDLSVSRAQADRAQAVAQLKLLEAGARVEDIQQAEAQWAAADSDRQAAAADLAAAKADEARFEQLLAARSGSQKQRDDAVTRRQLAEARLKAALAEAAAPEAAGPSGLASTLGAVTGLVATAGASGGATRSTCPTSITLGFSMPFQRAMSRQLCPFSRAMRISVSPGLTM